MVISLQVDGDFTTSRGDFTTSHLSKLLKINTL